MRDLAKQENVAPSYIGALIQLAFLAPDIIEAIMRGDVPVALSLGSLKKRFSARLGCAAENAGIQPLIPRR
jgi:hypothetical protein